MTFMTLENRVAAALKTAFAACALDPKGAEVTVSNRPEIADFQCNGLLPLGKSLGKNPRDLGEQVIQALEAQALNWASFSLAGPGFINIVVHKNFCAQYLEEVHAQGHLGCVPVAHPRTVFFDYGGMNVAKPMHVGHLRSSITGETLKRIYAFCGDTVVGDIHLGDWGTQMGMMIYALSQRFPDLPYFDDAHMGPYPKESPVTLDDLQDMYPDISAKCKEDVATADLARRATYELQQGRPGYVALWQHFVDVSIADMKQHLDVLGVSFDQWFGESRYNDRLKDMIDRFQKTGMVVESEGALVIPVSKPEDKADIPPLMLRKSDGGVLYATTDLATIEEREKDFGAQKAIYVVDVRQSLHFEQVFRAAHKLGFKSDLVHIGYGTMNGPDGKPFKTRTGGVMRLGDLIQMLRDQALARINEAGLAKDMPESERTDIADMVGVAALKFADLQHDISQNYLFDLSKFTRFEGKTGPYLLYAAVRIQSILRKAAELGHKPGALDIQEDREKELALILAQFPEVIARAYDKMRPNMLCDYAYTLAQTFSRFYADCHVLGAQTPDLLGARLRLCALTHDHLRAVLHLIGIRIPERM